MLKITLFRQSHPVLSPGALREQETYKLPFSQVLESPAASPATVAKPQRSILIDIVRGIAISLVALGHTNQGILARSWWHSPANGFRLDWFVYAFHMPAFFFVSGIFICASVEKRGPWRFTVEKLRTMIYPYLLLACIFAPIAIFSTVSHSSVPSGRVFLHRVLVGEFSWFLPTIFFVVILGMLLRRVPMPLLFVVSAVVSQYWPMTGLVFVDRGLKHLPFLVVGMWVGRSFERLERIPRWWAAIGAAALFVVIAACTGNQVPDNSYWFLPLGLTGTLMLLLLAHCLGHLRPARLLSWLGAGSIAIFLFSPFFQFFGRELLLRLFHTTAIIPQLLVPTALAILGPAWLYQRRVKLRLQWLFVWPF